MARDGGRIRRHVFRGYVPGLVSECADGSGRGTSRRWRRDSSPLLIREESLGRPFIAGVSKLSGVVRLHPIETLLKDAMETGLRIGHPIYDCLYIACARWTGSILVTADQGLARAVSKRVSDMQAITLNDRTGMKRVKAAGFFDASSV